MDDSTRWAYLHHRSDLGEFFLSSDTLNQSYRKHRQVAHIREQIHPDELSRFRTKMYSIGNMLIFPGRRIDGNMTINQARGCNRTIGDRFDLTLECIRLHYRNQHSPLADTLKRYADFFTLFGDFRGYVDYFLLRDLVTEDFSAVRFLRPFVDFNHQPVLPDTVDAFRAYLQAATNFIDARNQRILGAQLSLPQA